MRNQFVKIKAWTITRIVLDISSLPPYEIHVLKKFPSKISDTEIGDQTDKEYYKNEETIQTIQL